MFYRKLILLYTVYAIRFQERVEVPAIDRIRKNLHINIVLLYYY